MSSTIRTSTVVYASIGTLLTGALAYAVYFDHRRRTDAEFRRQLKRDSKKLAKASKVEAESSKKQERQELRDMVDEANEDGFPTDADEKEAFFMQEVGQGEVLCQQAGMAKDAALCFFKAMRVYPQPKELMKIYDKTVPKPILDLLAEMIAYDNVTSGGRTDSGSDAGSADHVE